MVRRRYCAGCVINKPKWECDTCDREYCERCLLELCPGTSEIIENEDCSYEFKKKPCYMVTVRCKECYRKTKEERQRNWAAGVIQSKWWRSRYVFVEQMEGLEI